MPKKYREKELRFFRLSKGVVDYSTEALRIVFEEEWDHLYPLTPWQNDRASGQLLLEKERDHGSCLYDPENKFIKHNLGTGDVEKWDVTTLNFALKNSHALQPSRWSRRGRKIDKALYKIKKVRNYVAHAKQTLITRSSFEGHIRTLLRAVKDLLPKSHYLVKKLEQLENETEFQTEDLLRYKKQLKDDRSGLLSLEKAFERLESKLEIDHTTSAYKAGSDKKNSENSKIILRLQTHMVRINSQVDMSPSKTRPDIFHRKKYMELMHKCSVLDWTSLTTYLDGISFDNDIDMKLYAKIELATALDYGCNSNPSKALEVFNSLIPYVGRARNGVVIHARLKMRRAPLLHDKGSDYVMKELDEAEQMLSLTECHVDIAEVNTTKANEIIEYLETKDDVKQVIHHMEQVVEICKMAPTEKVNNFIVTDMKYQWPLYQRFCHDLNSPQGITDENLESYRKDIAAR